MLLLFLTKFKYYSSVRTNIRCEKFQLLKKGIMSLDQTLLNQMFLHVLVQ
jgi:hypothetical protein